jgi:hypothetical protein
MSQRFGSTSAAAHSSWSRWFVVVQSTWSRWWFGLLGVIIFNSVAGAAAIDVTCHLLLVIGWKFSPSEGLFLSQLPPMLQALLFIKHKWYVCGCGSQQIGCWFVSVFFAWFKFG